MVIRDILQQASLPLIDERRDGIGVDKKRRPVRTLQEEGDVKRFIPHGKTGTVNDLRYGGEPNRHYIVCINHSVTVDIFIFDISCAVLAKLLPGRIVYIFL